MIWWMCPCMRNDAENGLEEEQVHLHKPRNNKLYQQNLKPCCLLVITTQKVVTLFVLTGLILLPIGIALLVQTSKIYEFIYDYTDCYNENNNGNMCKDEPDYTTCYCKPIDITIPDSVVGDMKVLYGLQNYYQNHRLYRQSQSFEELMGHPNSTCPNGYCNPFEKDSEGKMYYPKGAIANSFFTDDFLLFNGSKSHLAKNAVPITLNTKDISWKSDRKSKFIIPKNFDESKYAKPAIWQKYIDKNNRDVIPKNVQDEHFIVWMNPAAFPSFTKLYATARLSGSTYTLKVLYRYKIHQFGGRKTVIFAETSWMGGRSLALGVSYCIVGVACLVAAVFFAIISAKTRTKRTERKKKIEEQLGTNGLGARTSTL